jgi:cytochrome d ubiquinol oxidase subunit II
MDKLTFAFTALWTFLFLYSLLAAIDFGAGFLYWWAGLGGRHLAVRQVIMRYLSPVWETTNVFLIFFVVGMVGYFPRAAATFGVLLVVPVGIALMLLVLRGAFLAFHHFSEKGQRLFPLIFGLGSLLIPVFLVPFVTVSEDARASATDVLFSPLSVTFMLVTLTAMLSLSSVFLTWYAARSGEVRAFGYFRQVARWFVPLMLLAALLLGVSLWVYAPWHARALVALWPWHMLAALCFGGAWFLLGRKPDAGRSGRYGLVLLLSIVQYGLVFYAFWLSRLPYLLYPTLTLGNTATNPAMFTALTVAVVGGSVVLIPSLLLLYGVFLGTRGKRGANEQPQRGTTGRLINKEQFSRS